MILDAPKIKAKVLRSETFNKHSFVPYLVPLESENAAPNMSRDLL